MAESESVVETEAPPTETNLGSWTFADPKPTVLKPYPMNDLLDR